MPIYEYQCTKCGERTEEIHTTLEIVTPTHCDAIMEKILSASSFGFKTKGGNMYGFSGAHGRVERGAKKPAQMGKPGGKRKRATLGGKVYS